jgi:hypothetical protein
VPLQPIDTQRWLPWPEAVAVTSVRSGGNVTANVARAGAYRLGAAEAAPSNGVYTRYDAEFTVGQADLPFVPKPRDTVLWNGDTYTVLAVDGSDWLTFWSLTARNLVLAADLRQTGTLSRPSNAQDAAGRPARASYTTVTGSVPCRVQPLGGQATDALEKRTIPQRFTAFVGVTLDARAGDRFVCDGTTYTVTGSSNPERIDELQTLSLEILLP